MSYRSQPKRGPYRYPINNGQPQFVFYKDTETNKWYHIFRDISSVTPSQLAIFGGFGESVKSTPYIKRSGFKACISFRWDSEQKKYTCHYHNLDIEGETVKPLFDKLKGKDILIIEHEIVE